MINLDDFSVFFLEKKDVNKKEEERNIEKELEDLRLHYQNEILLLKKKYEENLEKIKEEYYQRGFHEGMRSKENELRKYFTQELERIAQEKEAEISKFMEYLKQNLVKFEEHNKETILKLLNSLVDSLSEIFEYLYISKDNLSFLEKKIKELIKTFEDEKFLYLEAGKKLYDFLEKSELSKLNIKLNQSLWDYDFKLNFKDFEIESKFSEKMKILKDEFEKEIKKLTKI
ncbi:hypothetical protein SAMN06269117_11110 [Balnearium lithotrophicum]|uniref:Flagellar assembly protein FliH n=1 Tax=Balnearium lithotrophicum TaxID=223788 RepID=A0A521CCB8_9BACT|nr:hypothetical protein [Balnearium lithotrophicum]SMO56410.1 hypothetical protein SAMN06269117_11110 [Balnearium lithotrophicum]